MHESRVAPGILSNDDLPAAFWDALPEKEEHPDLLAINALKDESTPQEQAEALKAGLPPTSAGKIARRSENEHPETGARE